MKNYLFIFIAIALFSTASCHGKNNAIKKQIILTDSTKYQIKSYKNLADFNADTVADIKYNFIENKDRYIGENLDLVFEKLEIPIVSFVPNTTLNAFSKPSKLNTVIGVYIKFFSDKNINDMIEAKKILPSYQSISKKS